MQNKESFYRNFNKLISLNMEKQLNMIRKRIMIANKLGMHARPATMVVKAATKYRSEFTILKDDMEINGKSIMGVMTLAAEFGSELELVADGVDEEYLIKEMEELFASKFGEE